VWIGQVGSLLGDWFNTVAVLSLLLRLTGSGRAAGLYYVMQMLPVFVASPLAGRVVDRLPRKAVMIGADLGRAAVVLALLLVSRRDQIWIVYAATALQMTLSAFFEPARTAVTPGLVRADHLVAANSLTAVTWSTMLSLGAVVGGAVAAVFGERVAFLANSASYLWSAAFVARAHFPPVVPHTEAVGRGFLAGLTQALRSPNLLPVLCVKGLLGLSGGIALVLAVFAERIYRVGTSAAGGIGLLFGARGLGTAIGPVIARRLAAASGRPARRAILAGFFVSSAAFLAGCLLRPLPLVLAAMVLSGIGTSIAWVFSTVVLQTETTDALRGRVFAAEQALLTLGVSLSMVGTGHWLDRPGTSPRTVGAGLALIYAATGAVFALLVSRAERASRVTPGNGTFPAP
jgi:predicted MFS family arabinose efflux permease